MKTFYQKIITEFTTPAAQAKFTERNTLPVQYINLYTGVEQFEETNSTITQPALLITWEIDYTVKPTTATVTIYACYEQQRDSSSLSTNQESGLKFLDYAGVVDTIVTGIQSEVTGKLSKISEGFHKIDSTIHVYRLSYKCSYSGQDIRQYEAGDYDNLDLGKQLTYHF